MGIELYAGTFFLDKGVVGAEMSSFMLPNQRERPAWNTDLTGGSKREGR